MTAPVPDLSAAVRAAISQVSKDYEVGEEELRDCDIDSYDALSTLVDLLEEVEPGTAPVRDDLIEAAQLVHVEIGLGEPAFGWLNYLQHAFTRGPGPTDRRLPRVHAAAGRIYFKRGNYARAAKVWQAALQAHQDHGTLYRPDHLRIEHAVCLHVLGRCHEAVAAVTTLYKQWKQHRREHLPTGADISTTLLTMLQLCHRQDDARAWCPDIAEHVWNRWIYDDLASWISLFRRKELLTPQHFRTVCAHRPASIAASLTAADHCGTRPVGPQNDRQHPSPQATDVPAGIPPAGSYSTP